jgi:branched-chain amino acid aminotransferase
MIQKAERQVYMNGQWVNESAARVSINDRGFTAGDGVYEAIRTFRHKPFRLDEHLERLGKSLRVARIDPKLSIEQMKAIVLEAIERNRPFVDADDDFKIYPTITRGLSMKAGSPATVIFAPRSISWSEFARHYATGAHIVTTSVRKQPPECYDAKVKSTSRFHHTLADIEAAQVDPDAYCLMLGMDGNVAENRSSNICIVHKGRIETPSPMHCLRGITTEVVFELAAKLGIPALEKDIQMYDVINADEVFLSATSFCALPVTRANGQTICGGKAPGPVTQRILDAFSDLAGFNVVEQATRRAARAKEKVLANAA